MAWGFPWTQHRIRARHCTRPRPSPLSKIGTSRAAGLSRRLARDFKGAADPLNIQLALRFRGLSFRSTSTVERGANPPKGLLISLPRRLIGKPRQRQSLGSCWNSPLPGSGTWDSLTSCRASIDIEGGRGKLLKLTAPQGNISIFSAYPTFYNFFRKAEMTVAVHCGLRAL